MSTQGDRWLAARQLLRKSGIGNGQFNIGIHQYTSGITALSDAVSYNQLVGSTGRHRDVHLIACPNDPTVGSFPFEYNAIASLRTRTIQGDLRLFARERGWSSNNSTNDVAAVFYRHICIAGTAIYLIGNFQ